MQVAMFPKPVAKLESAMKSDRSPKVLVLLNLADGKAVSHVAATSRTSRQSVYAWVAEHRNGGIDGFRVSPGRGRKCRADEEEIRRYIQQSPQNLGLTQTRWTLAALAAAGPSLKGFSPNGAIRHKRGQPSLRSPNPVGDGKVA